MQAQKITRVIARAMTEETALTRALLVFGTERPDMKNALVGTGATEISDLKELTF